MKDGEEKRASQSERFIEAARELGCDESEEAFNEKLKKVARQKVPEGEAPKFKKRPTSAKRS